MNSKLFDVLVAAICDGTETWRNLEAILLTEILDLDEEITVENAEKMAKEFLETNFEEANFIASRLSKEASDYLYEVALASRGW